MPMKTSPYASKLQKQKAIWKKAMEKKPDSGGDSLLDGRYRGRIIRAEVVESQSSGNLQVAWKATVVDGESKGEQVSWYSQLKSEDNMMYLQRDIARLGEDSPEDPGELEAILAKVAAKKPLCILTVKTNGDFRNVYIGKLLSEAEAEELGNRAEEHAAEETPAVEETAAVEEPATEPEEPAAEAEADVEIGMRVAFDLAGSEVVGEVARIDVEKEEVVVRLDTGKSYRLKADKLRPAPKTKVTKK